MFARFCVEDWICVKDDWVSNLSDTEASNLNWRICLRINNFSFQTRINLLGQLFNGRMLIYLIVREHFACRSNSKKKDMVRSLRMRINSKINSVVWRGVIVVVPANRNGSEDVFVPVELFEYEATQLQRDTKHTALFLVFRQRGLVISNRLSSQIRIVV